MRLLLGMILAHLTLMGLYVYLFLSEQNFFYLLCSIAWLVCATIDFCTFKIKKYLL